MKAHFSCLQEKTTSSVQTRQQNRKDPQPKRTAVPVTDKDRNVPERFCDAFLLRNGMRITDKIRPGLPFNV